MRLEEFEDLIIKIKQQYPVYKNDEFDLVVYNDGVSSLDVYRNNEKIAVIIVDDKEVKRIDGLIPNKLNKNINEIINKDILFTLIDELYNYSFEKYSTSIDMIEFEKTLRYPDSLAKIAIYNIIFQLKGKIPTLQIARYMGKNHATLIYGNNKTNDLIKYKDRKFMSIYNDLIYQTNKFFEKL